MKTYCQLIRTVRLIFVCLTCLGLRRLVNPHHSAVECCPCFQNMYRKSSIESSITLINFQQNNLQTTQQINIPFKNGGDGISALLGQYEVIATNMKEKISYSKQLFMKCALKNSMKANVFMMCPE